MKKVRIEVILFLLLLLTISALSSINCSFDTSGLPASDPPETRYYQCITDLKKCKKTHADASVVTLPVPPDNYQYLPPDNNFKVNDPIYLDKPYDTRRVEKINPPILRGAVLIRTRMADRYYSQPDYLTIGYNGANVDSIYVAYDSRATRKPNWLAGDAAAGIQGQFEPLRDAANNTIEIVTTLLDNTNQKIRFEVWKRKNVPPQGQISINGNLSGFPQWPANVAPAMYFVIVKPEVKTDLTQCDPVPVKADIGPTCSSTKAGAETEVLTKCRSAKGFLMDEPDPLFYNLACMAPVCTEVSACESDVRYPQALRSRTFLQNSVIEFAAPSFVELTVGDRKVQSNVQGELQFQYLWKESHMQVMRLNSMILNVQDLNIEGHSFTEIIVALLDFCTAVCQDQPPPVATPCNVYEIAPKTFSCSETFRDNGELRFFHTLNSNAARINIDHATRTFQMTGDLRTTIQINEEDMDMNLHMDLLGYFKNFQPKAVAGLESHTFAECVDDVNENVIVLNSGGSFDMYDILPPDAYQWFEDYGLVTEVPLGKQYQVSIPQGQLSYGVHDFALVVRDQLSVAGIDALQVTVGDTKPPMLALPADIIIFLGPYDTVPVRLDHLGEASIYDACAGSDVVVTNDAPANLAFQAGETSVQWKADDCRGNVTTKSQNIVIIPLEDSLFPQVSKGAFYLKEALGKSRESIEEWGTAPDCSVYLSPYVEVIEQMIEILWQASVHEGENPGEEGEYEHPEEEYESLEEEPVPFVMGILEEQKAHLMEIDSLIDLSNEEEEERADLRRAAAEMLEMSMGAMNEIVDLLPEFPSPPEEDSITIGGAAAGPEVEQTVNGAEHESIILLLSRQVPEEMKARLYVTIEVPQIFAGHVWARPRDELLPDLGGSYIELFSSPGGFLPDAEQLYYLAGVFQEESEDLSFLLGTAGLSGLEAVFATHYLEEGFPLAQRDLQTIQRVWISFH